MDKLYQGMVFFVQHREVTSSDSHFLVVVNPSPATSEIIVFGVVTSGIENAKKRVEINGEDSATLVKITPKDYPELRHDSVIDCNSPVKYSRWEFEQCFGQLSSQKRTDMPKNICQAVVHGVLISKQVSKKMKQALLI